MLGGCCGSLRLISLDSCDALHSCTAKLSKWLVMLMWTLRLQEEGTTEGKLHEEEKKREMYLAGIDSSEYFWPSPPKCLLFSLVSNCQVFSRCNIECVTSYSREISLEWLEQILLMKVLCSSLWQVSGLVKDAITQKTKPRWRVLWRVSGWVVQFKVNIHPAFCWERWLWLVPSL